jgi:hypothetical protein
MGIVLQNRQQQLQKHVASQALGERQTPLPLPPVTPGIQLQLASCEQTFSTQLPAAATCSDWLFTNFFVAPDPLYLTNGWSLHVVLILILLIDH